MKKTIIITICLLLISSTMSFIQKHQSRSRIYGLKMQIKSSSKRGCQTWPAFLRNTVVEGFPKKYLLYESYLAGKHFQIEEILPGSELGRIRSVVTLSRSGEILNHITESDDEDRGQCMQRFRGSWALHSNEILEMIIERTYNGKYFQHTVKSYFLGKLQDTMLNFQVIVGNTCDETNELDQDSPLIPVGNFLMVPTTSIRLVDLKLGTLPASDVAVARA